MAEYSACDIRRAAMDLLARREHTLHELREKLLRKFSRQSSSQQSPRRSSFGGASQFPPDMAESTTEADDIDTLSSLIDQALAGLADENLQSDERFVESFINGKKNKGHGPQRIRRELNQKRIAAELVEAYLDERDAQWLELARRVYLKKFGERPVADYREKARRLRFMQQRGFPMWMLDSLT